MDPTFDTPHPRRTTPSGSWSKSARSGSQRPDEDSDPLVGRRVGAYRIEELLAVGGMGEVFRATEVGHRHRVSHKHSVALKRLPPEAAFDESLRRRFKREAEAAARIDHPAVARFLEIFDGDDGAWIAMEYVEGESLADVLDREGPMSPRRLAGLVRQIAEGLEAAHTKGIVHRDLKTENVLIRPGERACILDFGLAKHLAREESGGSTLTLDGTMVGTCRSMAPEQALAEPVDHRADLFSLGVLMYEALTGVSPFAATTPLQTVALIISHPQLPVRERNPDVPEELDDLVERLLSKDREDRPTSARQVIEELNALDLPDEPMTLDSLGSFRDAVRRAGTAMVRFLRPGAGDR